jgi:hypothetical protein
MASYHCSVKVGSKGKAGPHASYISREGKYENSRSNEKLEHVESGNMPKWAEKDPAQFWQAADQHERANGATYREIEVALPRELTPAQRVELVRDMVGQELGDKHAFTWAIHNPVASLAGGEQPHAHIMYSERTIDGIDRDPDQYFKRYNAKNPEKGGCRKDSAGTEERLQATRERWAKVQNLHLEQQGHEARVDHRSLKDQGIERTPEPHFGPGRIQRMTAMQDVELAAVLERRAAEGEKERAAAELGKSIIDLAGDLKAAIAERDQRLKVQEQAEAARQSVLATALSSRVQKTPVAPSMPSAAAVLANLAQHLDQPKKSASAPARLNAVDAALFQGTEQAIAVAQVSTSSKDIQVLASQFRKIDQVQSELTRAATPSGWDTRTFDERSTAQELANRDASKRREAINAEAKAMGITKLPFAVGQSTLISETFDYSQKAAAEALTRHAHSERPLGLFRRETKNTKAWDEQKTALVAKKAAWDDAIAWRDKKEAVATEADRATFYPRLDVMRKEHAAKSDAAIAKCAPARERLQDFAQERKRLELLVEKTLSPAKQQELLRERGRGRGHGAER